MPRLKVVRVFQFIIERLGRINQRSGLPAWASFIEPGSFITLFVYVSKPVFRITP